jgi:hypothetical protein
MANYFLNGGLSGTTSALSSIITYLAVGTGDLTAAPTGPNKADTGLKTVVTGYGLDAGAATVTQTTTTATNDTLTLTKTWTVTTGSKSLTECGASTSGGTYYSHAALSSTKNVGVGDSFTLTMNHILTN